MIQFLTSEKRQKDSSRNIPHLKRNFIQNPTQGISLGNNCYKVRLAIASKGKGKSGGARIITHVVHVSNQIVYLLSIFDKSEKEDLSDKELERLLRQIQ